MGKKFIKKSIIIGCLIATALLGTNIVTPQITPTYAYVNVLRGVGEVNITNSKLKDRLYQLLNKGKDDKLYADDFLTNDNYKATTTLDESTGIEKTTALRSYLDLSNCDITDISELAYFDFPQTLVAIDLSGNNLDGSHLVQLQAFLELEKDSVITSGETEITSKGDFKNIIKKVNLNFNNIDLDSLDEATINNSKLLYGIQNIKASTSGLILKKNLNNVKYYIRTEDKFYLSYNFYLNESRYNYTLDTITALNSKPCGDFKLEIANPPSSETGYFYGYNSTTAFTMFDIYIKDGFKVERKSLFNLRVNPASASGMDIIIEGLDANVKIKYTDPQTNITGTSYVNLMIEYNNKNTVVTLPFTVVDTTAPTIELKGYAKMYWKQNKSWSDPGYSGWDSGDNLTQLVEIVGNVDVTTCGTYTLVYKLKDLAGNEATTHTRTVVVQEQVLDELVITCNKTDYNTNDEIILTVQPASNTPISNYTDYQYKWYIGGVEFKTTTGDNVTGKSSITLILDKSYIGKNVTVKLTAKQKIDNSEIKVDSDNFELNPKLGLSDNSSIIIACAIAVILIVVVIVIIYYANIRKSKQKISTKKGSKKGKKQSNSNSQSVDIQVIKDYNANNNGDNTNNNSDEK